MRTIPRAPQMWMSVWKAVPRVREPVRTSPAPSAVSAPPDMSSIWMDALAGVSLLPYLHGSSNVLI